MTCATLSERKAQRIGSGPPDGGHIVSHRFERKSFDDFDDLDDDEDMDAQARSGRREVAWPRESPGRRIEFEKSTPALELLVVFRASGKDEY
jgi:hypothetical protein